MQPFAHAAISSDTQCCGPWNHLLNTLFPFNSIFVVAPMFLHAEHSTPIALFVVHAKGEPVLVVELLPQDYFASELSRKEATSRLRNFFLTSSSRIQVPVLHGICAFGTKFASCKFHKLDQKMELLALDAPSSYLTSFSTIHGETDTFSPDWWCHDITEPSGALRFREIVEDAMLLLQSV